MNELQDAVTLAEDLRDFRPSLGDVELEAAIDIELTVVIHDERYTQEERVAAFERVKHLHGQRRPQMVAYLEREKGIAK